MATSGPRVLPPRGRRLQHPTGLATGLPGFRTLIRPLLRSPEEGADTAVWLAAGGPTVAAQAGGTARVTSGFFLDRHPRRDHRFPVHPSGPADPEDLLAWCAARTGTETPSPGGKL